MWCAADVARHWHCPHRPQCSVPDVHKMLPFQFHSRQRCQSVHWESRVWLYYLCYGHNMIDGWLDARSKKNTHVPPSISRKLLIVQFLLFHTFFTTTYASIRLSHFASIIFYSLFSFEYYELIVDRTLWNSWNFPLAHIRKSILRASFIDAWTLSVGSPLGAPSVHVHGWSLTFT